MARTCPQCGAVASVEGDAYCGICRAPFDVMPVPEGPPAPSAPLPTRERKALSRFGWVGLVLVLGASALLFAWPGQGPRPGTLRPDNPPVPPPVAAEKRPEPPPPALKRLPPAETPEKALAQYLAAARAGDLDTIIDLHPDEFVEPLHRLVAARQRLYRAHCQVVAAMEDRFGVPAVAQFKSQKFKRGNMIDQERERLRMIDNLSVRSKLAGERLGGTDEPTRYSIFVDITVGKMVYHNWWEFVAVKEADGWKLMKAIAFRVSNPDRPPALVADREAGLSSGAADALERVAAEVRTGKHGKVEGVEKEYDRLFNRPEYVLYDTLPLIGWDAYDTPPGGEYWPKK